MTDIVSMLANIGAMSVEKNPVTGKFRRVLGVTAAVLGKSRRGLRITGSLLGKRVAVLLISEAVSGNTELT
jgi:hypothetical protein